MADEQAHTVLPGDPLPAEQFDDLRQQHEAGLLGMWIFLATEVLLFGGMFAAYISYRHAYAAGWHEASRHLYLVLGSINTAVLLGSSWMVALAVWAARHGSGRVIARYLLAAVGLGAVFLGIKGTEYFLEYREHLVPWLDFRIESAHPREGRLFFVFYFLMTGLHAVHMIVGMSLLLVIAWLARRGRFSPRYHNPVELAGLYWHFVDIVWVFLYPAFYLVNPHR